jgi:hypothetical protein
MNLGLFYDCLPLVLILWCWSPFSNIHCLQVFNRIQPSHLIAGLPSHRAPSGTAHLAFTLFTSTNKSTEITSKIMVKLFFLMTQLQTKINLSLNNKLQIIEYIILLSLL